MSKNATSIVHGFIGFTNKSLIKNLIVITLCILFLFVQVFYPYQYYASAQRNANSPFQVGIHYVYEQDSLDQIYSQITHIHDLGFKAIRITLECNPLEYNDLQNQKTDTFFSATDRRCKAARRKCTRRSASTCAAMTRFQVSGMALEITKAQSVPAGPVPAQGRGGRGA